MKVRKEAFHRLLADLFHDPEFALHVRVGPRQVIQMQDYLEPGEKQEILEWIARGGDILDFGPMNDCTIGPKEPWVHEGPDEEILDPEALEDLSILESFLGAHDPVVARVRKEFRRRAMGERENGDGQPPSERF